MYYRARVLILYQLLSISIFIYINLTTPPTPLTGLCSQGHTRVKHKPRPSSVPASLWPAWMALIVLPPSLCHRPKFAAESRAALKRLHRCSVGLETRQPIGLVRRRQCCYCWRCRRHCCRRNRSYRRRHQRCPATPPI